jgi:hypothetical protein
MRSIVPVMKTPVVDFGERIDGARKHSKGNIMSGDMEGMNEEKLKKWATKDAIWPAPDYRALFEAGHDRGVLMVVKAMRDMLPSAAFKQAGDLWHPGAGSVAEKTLAASKAYADMVNHLRTIEKAKAPEELARWFQDNRDVVSFSYTQERWSAEVGPLLTRWGNYSRSGNMAWNVSTKFDSIASIWHQTRDQGDGVETMGSQRSYFSGTIASSPFSFVKKNPGWPAGRDMTMVWANKRGFHVVPDGQTGQWRVTDIYDQIYLFRRVSSVAEGIRDRRFPDEASAAGELKTIVTAALMVRKKEADERRKAVSKMALGIAAPADALEAKDWTDGREITGEDYLREFGFRGGQFGNWVTQKERRELMREGYNALCDLADVLEVPRVALSHCGSLGIGFGSRGRGGKDAPAAHYEPGEDVINLTRLKGAGCLAHEWLHSFDHHLYNFLGRDMRVGPGVPYSAEMVSEGTAFISSGWRFSLAHLSEAQRQSTDLLTYVGIAEQASILGVRPETVEEAQERKNNNLRFHRDSIERRIDNLNEVAGRAGFNGVGAYMREWLAVFINGIVKPGMSATEAETNRLNGIRRTFQGLSKLTEAQGIGAWVKSQLREIRVNSHAYLEQYFNTGSDARVRYVRNTAYRQECLKVDAKKGRKYFSLQSEMFARSFEAWIDDRLRVKGRARSFLVGATVGSAYPQGVERERINRIYDAVFGAWARHLKSKETELTEAVGLIQTERRAAAAAIDVAAAQAVVMASLPARSNAAGNPIAATR